MPNARFGEIAIERGLVTEADVEAALQQQAELRTQRKFARIAFLLARKKRITPQQALELLGELDVAVYTNPDSGRNYNVTHPDPNRSYLCPVDSTELNRVDPATATVKTLVVARDLMGGRTRASEAPVDRQIAPEGTLGTAKGTTPVPAPGQQMAPHGTLGQTQDMTEPAAPPTRPGPADIKAMPSGTPPQPEPEPEPQPEPAEAPPEPAPEAVIGAFDDPLAAMEQAFQQGQGIEAEPGPEVPPEQLSVPEPDSVPVSDVDVDPMAESSVGESVPPPVMGELEMEPPPAPGAGDVIPETPAPDEAWGEEPEAVPPPQELMSEEVGSYTPPAEQIAGDQLEGLESGYIDPMPNAEVPEEPAPQEEEFPPVIGEPEGDSLPPEDWQDAPPPPAYEDAPPLPDEIPEGSEGLPGDVAPPVIGEADVPPMPTDLHTGVYLNNEVGPLDEAPPSPEDVGLGVPDPVDVGPPPLEDPAAGAEPQIEIPPLPDSLPPIPESGPELHPPSDPNPEGPPPVEIQPIDPVDPGEIPSLNLDGDDASLDEAFGQDDGFPYDSEGDEPTE